jgi:sortase (surface protein transpeptidase)
VIKTLASILMVVGVGVWIGIGAIIVLPQTKTDPTTTGQSLTVSFSQINPGSRTNTTTNQPRGATTAQPTVGNGLPKNLRIPKIGVNAAVEYVGQDAQGRMDVPKKAGNVAWYQYPLGYKIGDSGAAVLSGHLDTSSGAPAVFYNIGKLNPGDEIMVTDTASKTFRFRVYEKQSYPYDALPLKRIFGSAGQPGLNLITCSGTWDRNNKNYSQRIVLYASLIP